MRNRKKVVTSDLMPLRVGIDLVEIKKIRKTFERGGELKERVFTAAELRSSFGQKDPYISLAALFAIKEAVFKALGTGLSGSMDWREVEVQWAASGTPLLRLCGETARMAHELGVTRHALSMSRTREYGVAVVLFEGSPTEGPASEKGLISVRLSSLP